MSNISGNIQNIITILVNISMLLAGFGYLIYLTKVKFNEMIEKSNRAEPIRSSLIKGQSDIDVAVYKRMEETKEIVNADTVQLFEFHNGGHWANCRRALKTSCTFEVCRYGVKGNINQLKEIPLSVIPLFVQDLLTNGSKYIENIKDIESVMPSTYNLFNGYKVNECYAQLIYNNENDPVGFVLVSNGANNKMNMNTKTMDKLIWFIEDNLISSLNK